MMVGKSFLLGSFFYSMLLSFIYTSLLQPSAIQICWTTTTTFLVCISDGSLYKINKSVSHLISTQVVNVMEDTRLKGNLFLKRVERSSSDVHLVRTTKKDLISGGPFFMEYHSPPQSAVPPPIAFPKPLIVLLMVVCCLRLLFNFQTFQHWAR